ncbi:hypothetical protein BH09ACT10_BH09ACT10_03650 [soil metagenome]
MNDELLTKDEVMAEKAPLCICGLTGRQFHMMVTDPGVGVSLYARTLFECIPSRPGPHGRADLQESAELPMAAQA